MRYGIFGGTFDPFTPAHYEIVNKVLEAKLADKVIVLPTIVNYYRKDKNTLFDFKRRKDIVHKWFDGRDDVILDFYEYDFLAWNIKNFGTDKMLRNRRYLHMLQDAINRHEIADRADCLTIVGGDSFMNFKTWFKWQEVLELSELVVVGRGNAAANMLDDHDFNGYGPFHLCDIDAKFSDISATKIREHLEDACNGMSMGPNGTPYNLYIDEIDDYKKTRKTWLDRQREYDLTYNMLMKDLKCKKEEKLLAHTPIFDLVEAPEIEAGFKPVKVKSPDWVSVIAEKDGKFLVVMQRRHGLNKEFEEFPCGMVEDGEDIIAAGLRELAEETGYRAVDNGSVHYLGKLAANPAFMTNYMHYLYVNFDNAAYVKGTTQLDEHEHLTSYWIDKHSAFEHFIASNGSALMGGAWMLCMKNHIA